MPIKKEMRHWRGVLFAMYGHCHYCHERVVWEPAYPPHPRLATLDHLTPRCRGGEDEWSNLVLACLRCNNEKDDMTEAEYRKYRRRQSAIASSFPGLSKLL